LEKVFTGEALLEYPPNENAVLQGLTVLGSGRHKVFPVVGSHLRTEGHGASPLKERSPEDQGADSLGMASGVSHRHIGEYARREEHNRVARDPLNNRVKIRPIVIRGRDPGELSRRHALASMVVANEEKTRS
jgi:hypothetical protein